MSRVERVIIRTPELAEALRVIMEERNWGRRGLARAAGVTHPTVSSMLYPDYPGGVSKELGARIIETLTVDSQERIRLFELAGIAVYRLRGSNRLFKLL